MTNQHLEEVRAHFNARLHRDRALRSFLELVYKLQLAKRPPMSRLLDANDILKSLYPPKAKK